MPCDFEYSYPSSLSRWLDGYEAGFLGLASFTYSLSKGGIYFNYVWGYSKAPTHKILKKCFHFEFCSLVTGKQLVQQQLTCLHVSSIDHDSLLSLPCKRAPIPCPSQALALQCWSSSGIYPSNLLEPVPFYRVAILVRYLLKSSLFCIARNTAMSLKSGKAAFLFAAKNIVFHQYNWF